MAKYGRWVIFGAIAIAVIIALVLVGANKNLRQRLTALLLERKVKTEIQNLRDLATAAKAKADANKVSAEEAEAVANNVEIAVLKQKQVLQANLQAQGMSSDEIISRFSNLGI